MIKRSVQFLCIIIMLIGLNFADQGTSQILVQEAWSSWEQNNQSLVEQKFKQAISEDGKNIRAYLGLYFLYEMQNKYEQSWEMYQKVLQNAPNQYPYIFAVMNSLVYQKAFVRQDKYLLKMLKSFAKNDDEQGVAKVIIGRMLGKNKMKTKNDDEHGVVKVMANQGLGQYYTRINKTKKSKSYYDKMDALDEWMVIGPFDNISASGFNNEYPPEIEFDPEQIYNGKNNIPANWFEINDISPSRWIFLTYYFASRSAVYYGNTFVYSPEKQTAQIRVGTSGSLKVFLNDDEILQYEDENNNDLDTYIVETELQKGWNRLLIKCGYSEISRCNFLVRITDNHGNSIDNLKYSKEKNDYPAHSTENWEIIENFAEVFFKQKVEENPEAIENYILLALTYLRNDKAEKGEKILKKAVAIHPNCTLPFVHLYDAFRRGEKYDEIGTTFEKIFQLDNNIPTMLDLKIREYIKEEEFDEADILFDKLKSIMPDSPQIYKLQIEYYSQKDLLEDVIKTVEIAYNKYPNIFDFVNYKVLVVISTTKDYNKAISIYKKYLKYNYDPEVLSIIANIYMEKSDIQKWESTYKKILATDPAAPGYYVQMSEVYLQLQKYHEAAKSMEKAISICPNASRLWSSLGEIYRSMNNKNDAASAYNQALRYDPTNYDAREKLRDFAGKKSIFSIFSTFNRDSLIQISPSQEDYPDDDGIYLYDDKRRVVYESGASQTQEEILIKIFNKNGIETFKDYYIPYNSNTEGLIIEEAIVIKADGSEIDADRGNYGRIVFKTLEENDHIYLKWKVKNYYNGKLSRHFWDEHFFNGFFPILNNRYSLLVPDAVEFNHEVQNSDLKPTIKSTESGTIYQWFLKSEPALEPEIRMPAFNDVGKILRISSISDWEFIVDWYLDLAQSKAKSTYEIKDAVTEIFQGHENPTEQEKIEMIYNYITENIAYSSVSFRQSGLIPQKARDVLVNKIGDCKDMAALSIAMLAEVDVNANFILVNTRNQGKNQLSFPSIDFNHCITAVETEDGLKYLDLTAHNYPFGSVPDMDIDAFSLLIKDGTAQPQNLNKEYFQASNIYRKSDVVINEDNSIDVSLTSTRTSGLTAGMRNSYRHTTQREREKDLSEDMSTDYPNIIVKNFELENLDSLSQTLNYSYNYEVPDYLTETGSFKFFQVPWSDKLESDKSLSYEERVFPIDRWYFADSLSHEIKITLPEDFEPVEMVQQISYSSHHLNYSLSFSFDDGVITGVRSFVYKNGWVTKEEYSEFKELYNKIVKADKTQILIKKSD